MHIHISKLHGPRIVYQDKIVNCTNSVVFFDELCLLSYNLSAIVLTQSRGTMAKDETKGAAKKKRPTAEKRMIQNKKRRADNRVLRSKIRTGIRRFEDSIKAADTAAVKEALSSVFSALDKGVKQGVLKKNTASRTKSRLTARAVAAKA